MIFHRQTGENPLQPAGANEGEVQGESIQPAGQRHDLAESVPDGRAASRVSTHLPSGLVASEDRPSGSIVFPIAGPLNTDECLCLATNAVSAILFI